MNIIIEYMDIMASYLMERKNGNLEEASRLSQQMDELWEKLTEDEEREIRKSIAEFALGEISLDDFYHKHRAKVILTPDVIQAAFAEGQVMAKAFDKATRGMRNITDEDLKRRCR